MAVNTAKEIADETIEADKKIQEFKENAIKIATNMIQEMGSSMVGEISKMIGGKSADLPEAMKNALTSALTELGASLPPKTAGEETSPSDTITTA